MKAETIVTLAMLAAAWPYTPADRSPQGTSFSALVVFGDSFSDNGNGSYRITNGSWPPNLGYYEGRFSNGPVWAEYVAGNLSIPLLDYAVGGATTSNALVQGYTGPKSTVPVPSVLDQIANFLDNQSPQGTASATNMPSSLPNPLFAIMAGANDVLFNPNISAVQSYQAIVQGAAQLAATYPGSTLMTIAEPDVAQLPYGFFADVLMKREVHTFSDELADLLAQRVRGPSPLTWGINSASTGQADGSSDNSATPGGAVVLNVDFRGFFDDLDYYAEPQAYGFAPLGKYGGCLTGAYGETAEVTLCSEVEGWVYWDLFQ